MTEHELRKLLCDRDRYREALRLADEVARVVPEVMRGRKHPDALLLAIQRYEEAKEAVGS